MPACSKLNDDFGEKLQEANYLSRVDYLSVVWTDDAIRDAIQFCNAPNGGISFGGSFQRACLPACDENVQRLN